MIDLAQHGKPPLGVTDQHDVDLRIHEIIFAVQLGQSRRRLIQRQSSEIHRAEQRQAHSAVRIQTNCAAQFVFAINFDSDLIVGRELVTARRADGRDGERYPRITAARKTG